MTVFIRVRIGQRLAKGCLNCSAPIQGVPNSVIRSTQMSMPPRFETSRETAVITRILADLVRTVQQIECEIAAQEERARVSDRSDVKYPMLARTLIERRDNLKRTIDALEQRLDGRAPEQATAA